MQSVIRLFKALPITKEGKKEASPKLLTETIRRGFVFSPEVVSNYSEKELLRLSKDIGLTPEQMNSSFHKSWQKIKDAPIEQLIIEQIIHYITTYGFEQLGIYHPESVYIPREALEIPEVDIDQLNLVVINGLTIEGLKAKVLQILKTGIALKEDTLADVLDIALFVKVTEEEIEAVRNKEAKIALYDYLGLFPHNPIEFLRYLIYKATEKTLIIKSPDLIALIKAQKNIAIVRLFEEYEKEVGLSKLAEVFYRYRSLWLAFRNNKNLKISINKIRRLAVKFHKPMPEDYLNEITAKIKLGKEIEETRLIDELNRVNIFRKIRLAYALHYRVNDPMPASILYRIRNGKGYSMNFSFPQQKEAKEILDIVVLAITQDIRPRIEAKKIYIPSNIEYSLPATEKMFTGNFPSGSFVKVPKDMIFGIYWRNVRDKRIDLDLSIINLSGNKFGWDGVYRSKERNILFSGDMTDAEDGATEFFYIQKQANDTFLVLVNYYNFDPTIAVPVKIIVAQEHPKVFKKNYLVNQNNVLALTETKIEQKQKILGLVTSNPNGCNFYFAETNIGSSITSSEKPYVIHAKNYLYAYYSNPILLKAVLEQAGGIIVAEADGCDIDLSPEKLEQSTIITLLSKNTGEGVGQV